MKPCYFCGAPAPYCSLCKTYICDVCAKKYGRRAAAAVNVNVIQPVARVIGIAAPQPKRF